MGIFDSIAGALSNIFGGGTQQSNTAHTASSGSNTSDYGSNDYLAAGSATQKQIKSKKSPGSTTTQETTITQQPQQTQLTTETSKQQQPQQSVMLPSIDPAMNKLQQNSDRKDTAANDKQQDSDTVQDKASESDATKYQDILSQLPNPLEAIGSWINPEVADAQSIGEMGQEIQKELAANEAKRKADAEKEWERTQQSSGHTPAERAAMAEQWEKEDQQAAKGNNTQTTGKTIGGIGRSSDAGPADPSITGKQSGSQQQGSQSNNTQTVGETIGLIGRSGDAGPVDPGITGKTKNTGQDNQQDSDKNVSVPRSSDTGPVDPGGTIQKQGLVAGKTAGSGATQKQGLITGETAGLIGRSSDTGPVDPGIVGKTKTGDNRVGLDEAASVPRSSDTGPVDPGITGKTKDSGTYTVDDNGHTVYKQNNKYGNSLASAYAAATTGDSRVGLDEAVSRDAYAKTGDERYNPDSDKYYLKHQGEEGYEGVNPYDIDGYEDFQEFYTGRHEDGSSWSKGETRRWIMQHPDVATYIVNTPEMRAAIEDGTLDKATFRGIVDGYVDDMYDKAYTAADVQAAKKAAESSGDMGDFYNTFFSANTVDGTGLNEVLNNSFANYIASQMNTGDKYNTGSKAYDQWLNNLVTQGKFSDGNLAADNGHTKDAYTYKDIIDAYNQAQTSGGADEQTTAMYNDAINRLAANLSLADELVMANTTNKNNMSLDTINNTIRKHYNQAGLYGDMDELIDLGDQYRTDTNIAQELSNNNTWAGDIAASLGADEGIQKAISTVTSNPLYAVVNPLIGIPSLIQKQSNDAQAEKSKNATAAVDAAEDKGAALYDAYRDTSEGDSAYSRAYDSNSMDLSTKQGLNALYRALSNNGISQYNNDGGVADQEAIQKRVDELNSSNSGTWAAGGYRTKSPNYDINPILTSLMASGYAAPTGTPSSLAYTFTPNNLKTAIKSTSDKEEQQS